MLGAVIEDVERRRKRVTVYSPGDGTGLAEKLAARNVTVETRPLPSTGPDPFVTVHDGDGFAGAITLDDLEVLLAPPVVRPTDREGLSAGYRALMEVLKETLFASLDRRRLLAASREIEDRALRVGTGELRVGFQSLSAFEAQVPVYRRLGSETDLELHVRGRPDWSPPFVENVTYHEDDGALARFWYLAFDGGDDPSQACALVARQRDPGGRTPDDEYAGFWTYDAGLVAEILGTVRAADG